ncbi:hypothetical protein O181_123304 [Austropuccinia psidii MF-1]|uniref:Uncharacterized protein n=1 Tax=Austropuccinia psidii MF-1 TaxID=1389203 RepID=A0A9Q3KM76_9BASI|nr:hypothetical protein [Austropuccinia psidii MF-1]
MTSTRLGASYNLSSSSQKGHRRYYGRSQSVTEGQGGYTATRSLSGHLKRQPEGLQKFIAAQKIPDTCRSVEKLHELLPDCEKIPGPSQHLQVTQWMSSIYGKEKHDPFNRRMEGKQGVILADTGIEICSVGRVEEKNLFFGGFGLICLSGCWTIPKGLRDRFELKQTRYQILLPPI